MTVEIRKLGEAAGAEVLGLDMLRPWDDEILTPVDADPWPFYLEWTPDGEFEAEHLRILRQLFPLREMGGHATGAIPVLLELLGHEDFLVAHEAAWVLVELDDHAVDAIAIPIGVRLDWNGAAGPRSLEMYTLFGDL